MCWNNEDENTMNKNGYTLEEQRWMNVQVTERIEMRTTETITMIMVTAWNQTGVWSIPYSAQDLKPILQSKQDITRFLNYLGGDSMKPNTMYKASNAPIVRKT